MKFDDQTVEDVGSFSKALKVAEDVSVVWYRGHRDISWKLEPTIARNAAQADAEHMSIKRFKQNALPFIRERPQSEWEWMFLMQHHRAPTRLLDWSESALVSLHFALEAEPEGVAQTDAIIWCLSPVDLNANAGHKRKYDKDVLAFGVDTQPDNYLPERIGTESELDPIAAIGPRNSARMVAQAGTFTITHANHTPLEELEGGNFVWRIIIPANKKAAMRKELEALGVNELLLFPDLDRVALHTGNLLK